METRRTELIIISLVLLILLMDLGGMKRKRDEEGRGEEELF
jgi:hypothetical protein